MEKILLFALLLPLLSATFLMSLSSQIAIRLIGCSSIFFSFCSMAFLFWMGGEEIGSHRYLDWISVQGFSASFSLHLDHLSIWMGLIITGVGFLIHLYSIGYMDPEISLARYFACMNFFIFSMLLLVLADNLLLLYFGWEGVGAASYLLIGFWFQKPSAERASRKAFLINRIGDFGMLLGIFLAGAFLGTIDISAINALSPDKGVVTIITLLLFIGAIGKSAQLPLQSWLPDAMEGPTPVSALIHAATMVTAGVYLVVRLHPLFELAPFTLQLVGWVGGITALYAAFTAIGQDDLKRVLAYSTMSQLGLMFLACGAGAFYAAMFHLTTHAFIKALLFLSAGNILHSLHGENNMKKMGGMASLMPQTNGLFLVGILALSGIPPLAAFFSKDLILEIEYDAGYATLYVVGLTTSLLTAFYLTRAYCLTFLGTAHSSGAHEAPKVMLWPLYCLAILSVIGGWLGFMPFHTPFLEHYLVKLGITPDEHEFSSVLLQSLGTWVAFFLSCMAILFSWWIYGYSKKGRDQPVLAEGFYLNQVGRTLLIAPAMHFADWITHFVEPYGIQGSLNASERTVTLISQQFQKLQNGQIRSYVAWMALGAALLLFFLRTIHV